MIGISCILHCYGNLVAMTTRITSLSYGNHSDTSFVLSHIQSIFGMGVP